MITQTIKKPIFRYHGGKWKMASWIISHMPAHNTYVEPYAGAASVLLRKKPVREEIINDLNNRLISVFHVLRNPQKRQRLEQMLRFTPYSRKEYESCQSISMDPVEDARRMFVLAHQSFASIGVSSDRMSGWRRGIRKNGRNTAMEWADIPTMIEGWGNRLSKVFIESMDAVELIKQTDSPTTLFYIDPPYLFARRSSNARGNYKFEMSQEQHIKLARVLFNMRGMAIISGYSSDLYDRQLYPNWMRIEKPGVSSKKEVIWLSPSIIQRAGHDGLDLAQKELFHKKNTGQLLAT